MARGGGRSIVGGALALWLAMAASPGDAAAQPAAEAVFEEGLRKFEAGQFAEACPRLEAAVTMTNRTAVGGMLLLAQCWEKIGRVASAWSLFREVAAMATQAGQEDRRQEAADGEARLAPRLHRIALNVSPELAAVPGLRILHEGVVVPREAWGVPFPADPGTARLRLEAPGRLPREREVPIPTTAGATPVPLEGALEVEPAAASPVGEPTAAGPSPAPESGLTGRGLTGLGVAGLVIGGFGVVGMGVGVAIGVSAETPYDEAIARCPQLVCQTAAEQDAVDAARGTGNLGTGVFVAGAVLTAVGGTLVVVDLVRDGAPPAAGGASNRRLALRASPAGATVTGSF